MPPLQLSGFLTSFLVPLLLTSYSYGDPLDRDPYLVLRDITDLKVSSETARTVYGVVLTTDSQIDEKATAEERQRVRAARVKGRPKPPALSSLKKAGKSRRIGEYLVAGVVEGREVILCGKCRSVLCPSNENYKSHVVAEEKPVTPALWPPYELAAPFVLREFYCPGCGTRLDVECNLAGEPPVWDVQIAPSF